MKKRKFSHSMTFYMTCPECEADVTIHFYPGSPARTGGGPDDWCDADPDDMDCDPECVVCNHEFSDATLDQWLVDCGENYDAYNDDPDWDDFHDKMDD